MRMSFAPKRAVVCVAAVGFAVAIGTGFASPSIQNTFDGFNMGVAWAQSAPKQKERQQDRVHDEHRDCEIRKDGSRDPECDRLLEQRRERDQGLERNRLRDRNTAGGSSGGSSSGGSGGGKN